MKKLLFWLLIITAGWTLYQRTGQVQLGPGVMAPAEPQQQMLQTPITQQVDAYQLTGLSSLTREYTGGGACELIWVKNLRIVTPKT